uniref:G_PROTEIN_RECEP_F1_2 domain-containing protein n=1 Tax=Strongyloides venezuelensis TaxID=75913 RepID=A0A0K0G564_STRVS
MVSIDFILIPIRVPIVEICGNAVSLIFIIIFFKHLIVSNHYHFNMRIFMMGLLSYSILIIIARFMIFLGLLEGKIFSSTNLGSEKYCMVSFFTLRIGSLGFNSIFYIITAERIIASLRYKTLTILTYIFYITNVLVSVAYIILIIVNNRLYKRSCSDSLDNLLSMKYQILENLQFLNALLPCIITYLIASIATTIIVFYYWSLLKRPNRSREDIFYRIEIIQLSDIVFTISFIIIPLITNYKLNNLVKFSFKKRNKISPSKAISTGNINTIGKSTKHNENEVYFEQFKKQWS